MRSTYCGLVVSLLVATGCSIHLPDSGSGGSFNSGPSTSAVGASPSQSWAIGNWYAPAYDDDTTNEHIPPKGLGITADGKYTHNTDGHQDSQGTWTMAGSVVTVGSYQLDPAPNCTFMNWNDGSRVDTYYRDDFPSSCPNQPPPLTAVEKCLVGEFSQTTNQNLDTTTFHWKRTDYRTEIVDQIYSQGNASFTEVYYWTVQGNTLCEKTVGPTPAGCSPIDWNMIDSTRVGAKDPDCVEPGSSSVTSTSASTGSGQSCGDMCESQHPSGYAVLEAEVIQYCGCQSGGPCQQQCSATAACTSQASPSGSCSTCLQTQANLGVSSDCTTNAAFSSACQNSADCSALVECVLGC